MDCLLKNQPLVSIGIPCFNRPAGIKETLECFLNQSYKNIEIIISDNCSTDQKVWEIITKYSNKDLRIKPFRQDTNKGSSFNFEFVLGKSKGKYFLWASDDDLWDYTFIEKAIFFLENNCEYHAWFPTIVNIDTYGKIIRTYLGFSRFTSRKNKFIESFRYVFESEIMGKANLMCSVYRRNKLLKVFENNSFGTNWGMDMCFVLSFISRYNIKCIDEVLLQKRIQRPEDDIDIVNEIIINKPFKQIFPIKRMLPYFLKNLSCAYGFLPKVAVILSFFIKTPIAIYNKL